MTSTSESLSLKSLLAAWPRGEPRTTTGLLELGVSPYRASSLARAGWLEHLARGVYKLPGDLLDREASIALLAKQLPGLHVGGKTAFDLRGVRHNLVVREVMVLWGDRPGRLPGWFTKVFPATYRYTPLFDSALRSGTAVRPLPNGRADVPVSEPERALLELLSDVGKGQSLAEATDLVEGLPNLREKVLDNLLRHTTRVKVVRLAHALASRTGQPWAGVPAAHAKRLGSAGWVAVTKSGERIDLRRS